MGKRRRLERLSKTTKSLSRDGVNIKIFLNMYYTFNHIHRNLTSFLPRVLAVRFPHNVT